MKTWVKPRAGVPAALCVHPGDFSTDHEGAVFVKAKNSSMRRSFTSAIRRPHLAKSVSMSLLATELLAVRDHPFDRGSSSETSCVDALRIAHDVD